jgi:hypothetical protein
MIVTAQVPDIHAMENFRACVVEMLVVTINMEFSVENIRSIVVVVGARAVHHCQRTFSLMKNDQKSV